MNPTCNIIREISLQKSIGLYIHVPFCHARCAYCDFYSQTSCDEAHQKSYVDAVKASLASLAQTGVLVSTIYFGGGTPSVLKEHLVELVKFVRTYLNVDPKAEITVEVNPESLDDKLLENLMKQGVNRISMGVQSLDDRVLTLLSRPHSREDALKALKILHGSGINFSADLIASIPSTTPKDMTSWIQEVTSFKPSHLSLYPLSVEPKSALARHPLFKNIDEDFAADCVEKAWSDIEQKGYMHYEISNFALSGRESKHNTSYWKGASYIGIGPSASSALNCENKSRARFILRSSLNEFCSRPSLILNDSDEEFEILSDREVLREDIMLAMRLKSGVSAQKVKRAGLAEIFNSLEAKGLCLFDKQTNHFIPTKRGWMLGNEMFAEIWCVDD